MSTDRAVELLALRSRTRLSADAWTLLDQARASDPDPRVRSAALTVITERGAAPRRNAALASSATDRDATIRRRAAELAGLRPAKALAPTLFGLLDDSDTSVVEAAAAALGECPLHGDARSRAVSMLIELATTNDDAHVRESAVAALGSIGDARGLDAVLGGCRDKPAIRRRAVLALAAFAGPDVEAAIDAALEDRDWQTRQAAALLREGS